MLAVMVTLAEPTSLGSIRVQRARLQSFLRMRGGQAGSDENEGKRLTKEQIVEKLLRDSSCMVLGSAVAAFAEVCPVKWDIMHRAYRKLW